MIAKLLLQNTILCRCDGRAVVRVRRHAALARRVGVPGHLGDPRACLRIVACQDRSGAARRADAADSADEQPAADKKFMLAFGCERIRSGLSRWASTGACRPPPSRSPLQALGSAMLPALDRLHHVGVSRQFLCGPRDQGAGRHAHHQRDLDRALRLGAPSHV